jgi:sugar-specific transcriptional regulator TrmB
MQLVPEKDDISILSDLGLSNNQIKIYLALLKLGIPSKAFTIFQASGIPRQDVYRVLFELQQLGIVEKKVATPNEYSAVEPKKAVSILIQNKKQQIFELSLKAKVFSKKASKRYSNIQPLPEKDRFVLITEKQAIIHTIKEEIEKTQQIFYCIAPKREFLSCLTILSESLSLIKNKGVKVRWITQLPDREEIPKINEMLTKNPHIEVKCIPQPPSVKFALSDEQEIVLAVFEAGNFAETPALLTNSPAVISLARNYFEDCWILGKS